MLQPVRTDLMPPEKGAGVTLWYVAMRLALLDATEHFIIGHVRLLHEREGFPPPLPAFFLKGARRREGINMTSRWGRVEVDAWFDGRVPPELAAAADDLRLRRDAERLDARAAEAAAA